MNQPPPNSICGKNAPEIVPGPLPWLKNLVANSMPAFGGREDPLVASAGIPDNDGNDSPSTLTISGREMRSSATAVCSHKPL